MSLPEYKKQWNKWVESIYGDPKYKHHKNHEKHMSIDSTKFSDWTHLSGETADKVEK